MMRRPAAPRANGQSSARPPGIVEALEIRHWPAPVRDRAAPALMHHGTTCRSKNPMRIRRRLFERIVLALVLAMLWTGPVLAAEASAAYDAALARRLGADAGGRRPYVLVILKSGPKKVEDPEQRKAMFAGHFANMERLADAGKLALAGPFAQNEDGWRGLFLLAVATVEEATALTATDPVIVQGEMIAEYHPWFGSAAAMIIPETHKKLSPPKAE